MMTINNIRLVLATLFMLSISSGDPESFFFTIPQAGGQYNSEPDIGLMAWIDTGKIIDIYQIRNQFSTIDYENEDEILGTYRFYTDNYNTETINLYISSDGFIATFYSGYEPASKIISWNGDKAISSKFATAILAVGQSLGYYIDYRDIKYYDYRYPDANRMLIATQSVGESYVDVYSYGNLRFNIPAYSTVYETSYSLFLNDPYNGGANIAIDQEVIDSISGNGVIYDAYYGYISTNTDHLLGVMSSQYAQSGVAILMVYKDDSDDTKNNPAIVVSNADSSFDGRFDYPEYPEYTENVPVYTPTYTSIPTRTPIRTPVITVPVPTVEVTNVPTPAGAGPVTTTQPSPGPSTASINLYGERTDVELGQNILLKGSAVNYITKPKMHAQIIIIPPSGMSVVAADFVKSPAGQFTSDFEVDPGKGKDIEITIIPNQVGEFKVTGKIIYYFGDDKNTGEYHDLNLPIRVRPKGSGTQTSTGEQRSQPGDTPSEDPGFELGLGAGMLIISYFFLKNKRKI